MTCKHKLCNMTHVTVLVTSAIKLSGFCAVTDCLARLEMTVPAKDLVWAYPHCSSCFREHLKPAKKSTKCADCTHLEMIGEIDD